MGEYTNEQWARDLEHVPDIQVLAATMYAMMRGLQEATGVFPEADYTVMMQRLRKIMDTDAAS